MVKHKILFLLLVLIMLGTVGSGFFMVYQWDKPLGAALDLPTYTPSDNFDPSISTQPGSVLSPSINQTLATGASPTPTRQPQCNGPATMTILAIGSDERSTGYLYGLADSIHVIRIDFTIPNIMVVDFPRDLWVEIPGISDHYGITHGKLNQAYLFGNPGMGYYDGPGAGPGLMARTLDQNFGMRVDHYVAIDRQTFVHMIDAVGGVDIKVDTPIDLNYGPGTPDPRYYLQAGVNHLDGNQALVMATNRIPSTFQRMKYQKMILGALREKLLRPEMLPKLPGLVARFITTVQTDLSPSEINSLMCIAQAVPKQNIQIDSFPREMFKATVEYDEYRKVTSFTYEVDNAQLRAMVAEFMAGIWPMPVNEGSATPAP